MFWFFFPPEHEWLMSALHPELQEVIEFSAAAEAAGLILVEIDEVLKE